MDELPAAVGQGVFDLIDWLVGDECHELDLSGLTAVLAGHASTAPPTDAVDLGRSDYWINAFCFSPDGEKLAYGDGDGVTRVTALATPPAGPNLYRCLSA